MPPKKKPYSQLSKSAKHYRDNPASRKRKASADKEINAREEQKQKRRELAKKNYEADKRGVNRKGKDASHQKDGSIKYESVKKNRGNGKNTQGDRNARGKKK